MRQLRVGLSMIWVVALLGIGIGAFFVPTPAAIDHPGRFGLLMRCVSVWGIASGIFIYMVLVVDVISPKKPIPTIPVLKVFFGTLQWLALGYGVFLAMRMVNG